VKALLAILSICAQQAAAEESRPIQAGTDAAVVPLEPAPAPARLVPGDEIDLLEVAIGPPERFADHRSEWRVEARTFRFVHEGGEIEERRYRVVHDGERVVALVLGGDIQLIARTPDSAPTELRMPTERYHLDNLLGPSFPIWPFIEKVKTHGSIYREMGDDALVEERWEVSDRHLALVRSQSLPAYSVTARFVFTLDPIYGYRIDGIRELSFAAPVEAGKVKLGAGTFTPGCYTPWKRTAVFDRTVYTPTRGGMVGWANNLLCMDRCDRDKGRFDWRDGGFIAYLSGGDGWGVCFTRKDGAGGTDRLSVCNAHNDFHIKLHVPAVEVADEDGRYPYRYVHRVMALPPEMSAHVWDGVDLIEEGRADLVLAIGEVEDFEDQPVALTEPRRGLVWTARSPELVEGDAHSGDKAIRFSGRSWPNLPQVSLVPGRTYRLEGWFKLEPWSAEEIADRQAKDARRRAKLAAEGKELPPEKDWDDLHPASWIQGDFYEWSPHSGKMLVKQRTDVATATDGTWQHVTLDFTAPDWGPFVNIVFHARDCHALLDDFALREIDG